MSGKGSRPRPLAVARDEYARRHAHTFGQCDYCERAGQFPTVPTKQHGPLRLCEKCKAIRGSHGWLTEQEAVA